MSEENKAAIVSGSMGTAVVTGASSGIGKVYADRLAKRGYDLILVARRADRLAALTGELEGRYGIRAEALVADLANAGDLDRVAEALGANPALTMLVNNAGTATAGPLADFKKEDLQTLIDLNVTALSRLTIAVLPGFKSRDRGTIVNIGSVVSFRPFLNNSIYSATKGYVMNFTKGLQQELKGTKVRAQLVTPAATESEIWDLMGFPLSNLDAAIVMTAEDCVDAALQGLDAGEKMTVPSVHDGQLVANYETAGYELFAASQKTGKPAPRYKVGEPVV